MGNPINYNSRDYNSILADINADPELTDKPSWWKKLWAGIGDTLSVWLNSVANNIFLRTAYTRQAVQDDCQLIDYTLSPQTTSNGFVIFDINTAMGTAIFPFTVLKANLKARSAGSLSVASRVFESRVDVNFTNINDTFTVNYAINNNLTISTDLLYSGLKVRLSTTGTLPNPLQTNKDYFVIYKNSTTIALASTRTNAYAGIEIALTTNGSLVHTVQLYSKAISMYQQETLANPVLIGTSDGSTPWQTFDLPDKYVLWDTLSLLINSVTWNRVSPTLIDSISTDKSFVTFPKSNNQTSVKFGNNVYGAIPAHFDVYAQYSYGGGLLSNINSLDRVNSYLGSDSNLTACSNCTTMNGGADAETIINAQTMAPLLLKTRDRFITVQDGESLVLNYGGVSNCLVIMNEYGPLTCQVVGIASGGGDVGSTLWAAIQQYLIDRSVMGSIDVRFTASTITSTNVSSTVHLIAGYNWADVYPYLVLAFKLLLTEAGRQIYYEYLGEGIENAVILINTIFGTSFSLLDYNQITILLNNYATNYRNFGDVIQLSDVDSFVSFVSGVDYILISTFGTGLPLALGATEITTPGTINVTQIP